jgi:hypothetical protein
LGAFCLSALWQIYVTLYLLLRVQECRFTAPSQGAGFIVLSMGDGYSLICPLGSQAQQDGDWSTASHYCRQDTGLKGPGEWYCPDRERNETSRKGVKEKQSCIYRCVCSHIFSYMSKYQLINI